MYFTGDFCTALEILAFTLEEYIKLENTPQTGLSLILSSLFNFSSNHSIFLHSTIHMQLNVMHCVAFSDIDPFRRSAALKSTEFRLANKLENRSQVGK